MPAVLRDEDRAVGRERGAVRAAECRCARLGAVLLRPDAEQRARGDARDHDGAVGAPHRSFGKRNPGGDHLGLHADESCQVGSASYSARPLMGLRVINQMGPDAAAIITAAHPDVEIIDFVAGDPPAGLQADVFFGGYLALGRHLALDRAPAAFGGCRRREPASTRCRVRSTQAGSSRAPRCQRGADLGVGHGRGARVGQANAADVAARAAASTGTSRGRSWIRSRAARSRSSAWAGSVLPSRGARWPSTCTCRRCAAPTRRAPSTGCKSCTTMAELVADADHLVLAAPATAKTEHFVDAELLAQVKPGLHLVNIARGALVDQDALRVALDDGRVAMATLDTVDPEPLPAGHWLYSSIRTCGCRAHVSWFAPEHATSVASTSSSTTSAASPAARSCARSSIPTRGTSA